MLGQLFVAKDLAELQTEQVGAFILTTNFIVLAQQKNAALLLFKKMQKLLLKPTGAQAPSHSEQEIIMTLKIRFSHLMETVTFNAPLIRLYSRLSDRKVVSVHRLPVKIQSCTFTPVCVNKENRSVRLVSASYDHLMRAVDSNGIVKL